MEKSVVDEVPVRASYLSDRVLKICEFVNPETILEGPAIQTRAIDKCILKGTIHESSVEPSHRSDLASVDSRSLDFTDEAKVCPTTNQLRLRSMLDRSLWVSRGHRIAMPPVRRVRRIRELGRALAALTELTQADFKAPELRSIVPPSVIFCLTEHVVLASGRATLIPLVAESIGNRTVIVS